LNNMKIVLIFLAGALFFKSTDCKKYIVEVGQREKSIKPMREFGDEYSDGPDGNEGDNTDQGDTKDEGDTKEEGGDFGPGKKTLDLAAVEGKEPVEQLFSDDESTNKTVEPLVKEEDITKSGCSPPENFSELMEKGHCFSDCKFYPPGLVPPESGDDKCTTKYCQAHKGLVEFNDACDLCPLPWPMADGRWMSIGGTTWQNCNNKDKPCDFCSCEEVEGQKAKLHIETDGCRKPKRCGPICPHDKKTRRVGDKWSCWISDYNCPAKCECKEKGDDTTVSIKMYSRECKRTGSECGFRS